MGKTTETSSVKYRAAIYLRLSKEDGDKPESESITTQKKLILQYIKDKPEITVIKEMIDDGYSGVFIERPAFQQMLRDIERGEINCVIVKDLSRLGRNYIDAGKTILRMFPSHGVRFIAVNDNIDAVNIASISNRLMISFKNVMNDGYSRDISIKIRSHQEVKRQDGDFIGPFACYGYRKSPENKNKLIIDEDAAQVVQDIFKWKIEGLNQQKIADRLNMRGILSPIEHKKASGLKYTTSFKTKPKALWGAEAVNRILRNEAYLGVMEQGKKATPNYKVRQRKAKPKEEWVRVEGTHDPIISAEDFQLVSELLSKDLRSAPSKDAVYLFSGILYCDGCGEMMIHKTVTKKNGTKYHYYICSTYKKNSKGCTSHTINESELSNAVLLSIIHHINCIANIEEMLAFVENIPFKQEAIKKLETQITGRRDEIEQAQNRKLAMYEKLEDGKLSKADFDDYQRLYNNKINSAENALEKLLDEKRLILDNGASESVWIEKFKTHKNVTELSRNLIVSLIERITVFETGKISITYKYGREYEGALSYLFQALESVGVSLNNFAESGYRLKDFPQLNNIARDIESGDTEGADFPERKDSEHTTTEETVGEGQVFS